MDAGASTDEAGHCCGSEHCKCGEHGGRLIEPRLLLLLRQKKSYGYELLDRIDEIPLAAVDTGAVYRALRHMESEGLVKSAWDTRESGPAKRVYRITKDGLERLSGWNVSLGKRKEAIEMFIKTYEGR